MPKIQGSSGRAGTVPLPNRRSLRQQGIPPTDRVLPSSFRAVLAPIQRTNMAETREFLENLSFSLSNCVTKLTGKNYARWKRDIELRLKAAKLWACCTTVLAANADDNAKAKNARALSDIHESCEGDQQEIIIDCNTAKDAWDLLKTTFEPVNPARVTRLYRDFESCKKSKDETVLQFIYRVKAIKRDLTSAGETIADARICERYMMGLGPEYEVVKGNMNLCTDLTEVQCIAAMQAEESRLLTYAKRERSKSPEKETKGEFAKKKRSASPTLPSSSKYIKQRRPPPRCHGCGKLGHILNECWTMNPALHPARRNPTVTASAVATTNSAQQQQYQAGPAGIPGVHPQRQQLVQGAHLAFPQMAQMAYGWYPVTPMQTNEVQVLGANPVTTPESNEAHQAKVAFGGFSEDFPYPVANHPYNYHFLQMAEATHTIGSHIEQIGKVPTFVGEWLIDSGATNHYTANKSLLQNYKDIERISVKTGKGEITARGIGDVVIMLPNGKPIIIQKVMWLPELHGYSNLLSVPQLTQTGFSILFHDRVTEICRNGGLIATGSFRGRAFYLDLLSLPLEIGGSIHQAMFHGSKDTQSLEVWHRRLGHLNQEAIKKLTTMASGITIGDGKELTVSKSCDACLKGSQLKQISSVVRIPQKHVLGCVHMDIKGPCLDKDLHGFCSFMPITDEKTCLTKTYPLLKKSNGFAAFQAYMAVSERETGRKIMEVQFDGGGEFVSNEFRNFLTQKGIKMRVTAL